MRGELRILGVAHGLLLGLVLAAPMIGPQALPWGVDALFVVAAFQLRLADRRWDIRAGLRGWGSHIRMAPGRLLQWAATAVVALIAQPEQAALAGSILTAILLSEFLVYPMAANLLGRLPRLGLARLIVLLLAACGLSEVGHASHFAVAFALGMSGCVFWMRGPDGEAGATAVSALAAAAALAGAAFFPAGASMLMPAGVLAATITLAHLSVVRRQPQHWRLEKRTRSFVQLLTRT